MIIVAVTVLVALARMNRVLGVTARWEAVAYTPLAPVHTTRPQAITVAVAAGASTPTRDWLSAVSSRWVLMAACADSGTSARTSTMAKRQRDGIRPRPHTIRCATHHLEQKGRPCPNVQQSSLEPHEGSAMRWPRRWAIRATG